jgi:hypothetical protein
MNPPLLELAGVGVDVRDGGIGFDDLHQLIDGVVHERERGILRPLHADP